MCAVLLAVAMVTGMLVQAANGYFRFEPGLYLRELFGMGLPNLALLVVLMMTIQSLVNHKYVGHLLAIIFYVGAPWLHGTVLPHNLFHYSFTPETFYSDMNGYGHTVQPWGWYTAFWAGVAVLLAVASNLFWVRGMETGGRWRMRLARARFGRPALMASALALALIAGDGRLHPLQHRGAERVEHGGRGRADHGGVREAVQALRDAAAAAHYRRRAGRGHLPRAPRPAHPRHLPARQPLRPRPSTRCTWTC